MIVVWKFWPLFGVFYLNLDLRMFSLTLQACCYHNLYSNIQTGGAVSAWCQLSGVSCFRSGCNGGSHHVCSVNLGIVRSTNGKSSDDAHKQWMFMFRKTKYWIVFLYVQVFHDWILFSVIWRSPYRYSFWFMKYLLLISNFASLGHSL